MSILDPDQDQVMTRMTSDAEDIIRQRIREYCVFNYPKYKRGELWTVANQDMKITKVDKDEKGNLVPVRITAYKASPNRKLDLSFSSDGEPAEVTIEMSVLQNEDGDVMDIIEIEE